MAFIFFMATIPPDSNWNSTVLALTFTGTNGGTNNSFLDSSSNTVTVTPTNTSTLYLAQGLTGPQAGFSSLYYPGSASVYLSIPTGTNFNFGAGDYTVETWIKTSSLTTQEIISCFNSSAPYTGWLIGIGFTVNDGRVRVYHGNGVTSQVFDGTTVVTDGNWHHIAVSRSGSSLRIFVDGAIDSTTTINYNIGVSSNTTVNIGVSSNAPIDRPFDGYMSNLRITKGVALYTSAFTPSTTQLTSDANTSLLLKFDNAKIIDYTHTANIATVGLTQISTTQFRDELSSMTLGAVGNCAYAPPSTNWNLTAVDSTIEFWIYPTSIVLGLLIGQSNITADGIWSIYIKESGAIAIGRTGVNEMVTSSVIVANIWTHIAVVRTQSDNTTKIYINGTVSATGTGTYFTNSTTTKLYIGTPIGTSGWTGIPGYIDNVRITKGVARYTNNFTPVAYIPIS